MAKRAADTVPGRRESLYVEIGLERGLSPETLRAYLAGRRHIERIRQHDKSLAESLYKAPVDAVLALSRWAQIDPVKALEAAKEVASGKLSTRKVRQRAILAKKSASNPVNKQIIANSILDRKELYWKASNKGQKTSSSSDKLAETGNFLVDYDEIGKGFKSSGMGFDEYIKTQNYKYGGQLRNNSHFRPNNRRIDITCGDLSYERMNTFGVHIVIVGPYQLREYYTRRHSEWMMLATALVHFFGRAALFLPWGADVEPFQKWLTAEDKRKSLEIELVLCVGDGRFRVIDREEDFKKVEEHLRAEMRMSQADAAALEALFIGNSGEDADDDV